MKVRGKRSPRITTVCHQLPGLHRKLAGLKHHVHPFLFHLILAATDDFLQRRHKLVQMAINGYQSVGVRHIKGIAETIVTHRKPRHVAVAYGQYPFSHHTLRLHVDAAMEMVRTRFAETARHQERNVHRRMETLVLCRCLQREPQSHTHPPKVFLHILYTLIIYAKNDYQDCLPSVFTTRQSRQPFVHPTDPWPVNKP